MKRSRWFVWKPWLRACQCWHRRLAASKTTSLTVRTDFTFNATHSEIALKLDQVLNDPTLHARLRESGLATAQNYSWEKIAKQYLNLFNELLAERARKVQGFVLPDPSIST